MHIVLKVALTLTVWTTCSVAAFGKGGKAYEDTFGSAEDLQRTKRGALRSAPQSKNKDGGRHPPQTIRAAQYHPSLNLLPFGGGQWLRGSYGLGTLFGVTQLGAAALFFAAKQEADAVTKRTSTELEELQYQSETFENIHAFREARQAYVEEKQSQAEYALLFFAGSYLLGVTEAFINQPTPLRIGLSPVNSHQMALTLAWQQDL